MSAKSQWGIAQPHGWFDEWEEHRLRRQGGTNPVLSENATGEETVLVDHRGRPLLVRKPRPFGFRKP